MVNGRDAMMENIEAELKSLDSMRESGIKNIEHAAEQVRVAQCKYREANELQARFEQRTEMCLKLLSALEEFGEGMETLKAL